MSKDFTNRHGGGQKLNRLKRKSLGVIAIEVCFTLPVVIYLIFFTIELIKINITQDALQSLCEEATYLTIAHDYSSGADLINKIDAIIEKYRPVFIPEKAPGYNSSLQPVIRWTFETYPSLSNMLSSTPYGSPNVIYPIYEFHECASMHAQQGHIQGKTQFIPVGNVEYWTTADYQITVPYMKGEGLPNNEVFVLTVTCNYPFSNSLVKWLFNGGVNTKMCTAKNGKITATSHNPGTMYILWARGAGIVNAK